VALSAESGLTLKVEEIEDYSITEKIQMEKEVTGTYFLKHPVQVEKETYSYLPLQYIGGEVSDSYVEIITRKEIRTKNGDYMAFLTVNDGKNDYDVTVFPSVFKYANVFIKAGSFAVMTLKKQLRNGREQYILEKIASLRNYREYCLTNIKTIYTIIDKEILDLLSEYKVDDGRVKVIALLDNDSTKGKTITINNEHEFVQKFLEKFPGKRIKITYK
ncbi:MAG: DNA polymerase III subunit alpha, partial [Staphylococcus sp.]|nr:DNA polymerase III subunit alpha [Staphylococcus sp.]